MFCPQCEGEYRAGFTECADCGVPLVEALPLEAEVMPEVMPEGDLVPVFATSEAGLIAVVGSVLDAAGVAYMSKGESVQDMFALGRMLSSNPAVGPVEFYVRPDQEALAREVLSQIGEPLAEGEEPPSD